MINTDSQIEGFKMAPALKSQVVIDERLRKKISTFCSSAKGSCGLIIGQVHCGRHLVTHFIRASKEPSCDQRNNDHNQLFRLVMKDDDDKEEMEAGNDALSWQLTKERLFCPMSDIKDLGQARLPSLALQVSRLLPGGLQVLGIFLTSTEEVPKTVRPRLREIINQVSVGIEKDCPLVIRDLAIDDKIILAFEPRSGAVITSLSLDAADSKSIIKPIPVVFQELEWTEIQTRFRIELERPTDLKNGDVEGILKKVSDNYAIMVRESLCLADDHLLDSDRTVPMTRDGCIQVAFLVPYPSTLSDVSFSQLREQNSQIKSGRLAFQSDVIGRAYCSPKATVGFALQALKNDLLRSMTTRMELHCEDFLVTDTDEQEFDVVHELARRILAPLPDMPLSFSNYLHENEDVRDSLEVFVHLLDLDDDLRTSDLVTNVEKIPNQQDVDSALESVSTHSGEMELDVSGEETVSGEISGGQGFTQDIPKPGGHLQSITIVIAVLFALAFGLYQFYLLKSVPTTALPHQKTDEL